MPSFGPEGTRAPAEEKRKDLSNDLPSAALFNENVLLPKIREAIEKEDFKAAENSLRVLYGNLADRIAASYSENARDLLVTIQESYAPMQATVGDEPKGQPVFYLGQLKAVMELADRLARRTLPFAAVHMVMSSEVAKQILARLHEDGPMQVAELAKKLRRTHPYISTLLGRLEVVRIIRRRRFGQTVEVDLLPIGKELALQLKKEREEPSTVGGQGVSKEEDVLGDLEQYGTAEIQFRKPTWETRPDATEAQLFARLSEENPEVKRLAEKHRELDLKISELDRIFFLTSEQVRKRKELQKLKLTIKDQMHVIMRQYRHKHDAVTTEK